MSHFEADVLKVHMQNDKSELSIIQPPIDHHFLLFECKICPLSQQNSDLSALKSPWCSEILSELGIFRITVFRIIRANLYGKCNFPHGNWKFFPKYEFPK